MSILKKEIDFSLLKNICSILLHKLRTWSGKDLADSVCPDIENTDQPQSAPSSLEKTVDFPIKNAQSSTSHLDQKKTIKSACCASGYDTFNEEENAQCGMSGMHFMSGMPAVSGAKNKRRAKLRLKRRSSSAMDIS